MAPVLSCHTTSFPPNASKPCGLPAAQGSCRPRQGHPRANRSGGVPRSMALTLEGVSLMACLQTCGPKREQVIVFGSRFPAPPTFPPGVPMHIALTPEQESLREELREYFAALVTPEVKAGLASATGEFGETDVYKD